MSTDDVLSLIDGAIDDWSASEDAMRWRPAPDAPVTRSSDPVRLGDVAREVFAGHIPPYLIDAPASEFWAWVRTAPTTGYQSLYGPRRGRR